MSPEPQNVIRLKYKDLDEESFRQIYESKYIPVLIEGFYEGTEEEKFWTFEVLYKFQFNIRLSTKSSKIVNLK